MLKSWHRDVNRSCRHKTAGNGRRDTPDAYGSLATVRSTATSSRACRVCRAWGTTGAVVAAFPLDGVSNKAYPTMQHVHGRLAGVLVTSTPQRSTPSRSGAAHARGRRRRYARPGRPGQRLPTSSAHERAHQAIASPCPSRDHPVAHPSTTGDVGSAASACSACGSVWRLEARMVEREPVTDLGPSAAMVRSRREGDGARRPAGRRGVLVVDGASGWAPARHPAVGSLAGRRVVLLHRSRRTQGQEPRAESELRAHDWMQRTR